MKNPKIKKYVDSLSFPLLLNLKVFLIIQKNKVIKFVNFSLGIFYNV
ncbi:MAG: hypothetical protein JG780_1549 [Thermosipho sp. (in: Bacteria)]|jgi:hypothetical protein|nr:hypothetical protein [Thermosipho sp. (in: thermotogales)]